MLIQLLIINKPKSHYLGKKSWCFFFFDIKNYFKCQLNLHTWDDFYELCLITYLNGL